MLIEGENTLQDKIFRMTSGTLKGRYVYIWGEDYIETEFSPAFPGDQTGALWVGDDNPNFETVATRVMHQGGLEVTPEECGTLAIYFNLATIPELENTRSHRLKVFPALGVDQLNKVLANVLSLANTKLTELKKLNEAQAAQLDLNLRNLEKTLTSEVIHWLYYALFLESMALTIRPLFGTIYEVDERLLNEPIDLDGYTTADVLQNTAFIHVPEHGFRVSLPKIVHSLKKNKNFASISDVGWIKAMRTVARLRALGRDEQFCVFLDQTLADIDLAISMTSNYRKVVYSSSKGLGGN
jgi:hypothetical protein